MTIFNAELKSTNSIHTSVLLVQMRQVEVDDGGEYSISGGVNVVSSLKGIKWVLGFC